MNTPSQTRRYRGGVAALLLALCADSIQGAQPVHICIANFQPYNSPELTQGGPVIQIATEALRRSGSSFAQARTGAIERRQARRAPI